MHERRKELIWSSVKVGIVVTAALVIIFLAVFFSEGILGLFRPKAPLVARVSDVGGLRTGAPVWLLGVEVGRVTEIDLVKNGTCVNMAILRKQLRFINEDATATVRTMGLLGDKYVEINPGTIARSEIDPGDTIPGQPAPGLESVIEASARSIQEVEDFIGELEKLVGLVKAGEGLVGALLTDTSLHHDFRRTVTALASVATELDTAGGTLGRLVADTTVYHDLSSAVSGLNRVVRLAGSRRGTFYKMATDTTIYRDLRTTLASLARLTEESAEGGLATLLTDEQFAQRIRQTIATLNALLQEMKENPDRFFNFELF